MGGLGTEVSCIPHLHIFTVLILQTPLSPSASCSEPMWDFLPWPSRQSERASWTSPHATWIILWAFWCARPNALWTCLPAWHPSTCHCGRASRAPCSSLASWCTCSTGSTHPGYQWDLCPRQHCTIPCGLCTAPLFNKVRKKWDRGEWKAREGKAWWIRKCTFGCLIRHKQIIKDWWIHRCGGMVNTGGFILQIVSF